MIKVKIPKDNDGRAKQFAFVNFKHEVSVPYGMDLLNGTKLFGRPLKIQFRSGYYFLLKFVINVCYRLLELRESCILMSKYVLSQQEAPI